MGGNAILIDGDVNLALVTRPGFFGRLLGRKPVEASDLREPFADLPAKSFQFISEEFTDFLSASLSPAWPSTKAIMEYLKVGTSVYLRGELEDVGDRTWYLQLGFSGGAGTVQTSSDVAAHWAALWVPKRAESLWRRLTEAGFTPRGLRADCIEQAVFLPIGDFGYASYHATRMFADPNAPDYFDIDGAAQDALGDDGERLLAALTERRQSLVPDERCHCQMCDPRFDFELLRGLPGVG